MSEMVVCPEAAELQAFILGLGTAAEGDELASHVVSCPHCLSALSTAAAQDTLVEAVRAQRTMPEHPEQAAVERLVAKVRALVPGILSRPDQTEASLPPLGHALPSAADPTYPLADPAGPDAGDGFAPPQAPDEIGRLGGYRLLKLLGEGGMGKVFLAEDTRLRRKAALKVMKPELARNPTARQRFLQEARLAAAIEHDNIVPIYQVDEDRGIPFLAMQMLNGVSLEALLKRQGPLPIPQLIRIGTQVAEGLAAAHATGLIHRDIKPDNIWIEPGDGGRVKILDFGIARSTEDQDSLTQSGTIIGTPTYMAPEQAEGKKVDPRCDLYSLGCVLYRMATGELPLKGEGTMGMLRALALHEPTAPDRKRADLPPALSALILKLLAKDREKRPRDAREAADALRAIGRAGRGPEEPAGVLDRPAEAATGRRMPKLLIAVAAAALLSVLAGALVFYLPTANGVIRVESDDPEIGFKSDAKGNYSVIGKDGTAAQFSVGEHVLRFKKGDLEFETDRFILKKGDKVVVKIEYLKGKLQVVQNDKVIDEKKIGRPGTGADPGSAIPLKEGTWLPDKSAAALPGPIPYPALRKGIGRWQIVPAAAPETKPFAESPDGNRVAVSGAGLVHLHDARTGELVAVGSPRNASQDGWVMLDWSPDSKWVRYGHKRGAGLDNVSILSADGGASAAPWIERAEADYGWNPRHPILAVMFAGSEGRIQLIDPAKVKPAEIVTNHGGTAGKAVWSPDGESLLVVRGDKTAQLFGKDGKPGAKLEGAVDPSLAPVWSADGGTIAALAGPSELRFWKKDGSAGAVCKHAAPVKGLWLHRGRGLFAAAEEARLHFWKADGGSEAVLDVPFDPGTRPLGAGFIAHGRHWPALAKDSRPAPGLIVSPDGKLVVTTAEASLGMVEIDGIEATPLDWRIPYIGGLGGAPPAFSRDGKRVFANDLDGLAAYDVRDGKKAVGFGQPTAGTPRLLAVSPKGGRLAVGTDHGRIVLCDPTGRPLALPFNPLRFGTGPDRADVAHPNSFHQLTWHPDGRHLLAIQGGATGRQTVLFDTADGRRVAETEFALERFNSVLFALFAPDDPDTIHLNHGTGSAKWRWKVEKNPSGRFAGLMGVNASVSPDGKHVLGWIPKETWTSTPVLAKTKDLADAREFKPFPDLAAAPENPLAWLPDGKHFLAAVGGELAIHSLDGKKVHAFAPAAGAHLARASRFSLSPDRKTLLANLGGPWARLDIAARKWTLLPRLSGTGVVISADGTRFVGIQGSTIKSWDFKTGELERIVLLLPDGQHAVFSPAGEVLARSAQAALHYRHLVEDKGGRLRLLKPSEFLE